MIKDTFKLESFKIPNERIGTNIPGLDILLNGGILPGTILQLVAESGLGKTTISLQVSKGLCEQGKHVLYIDTEGSITNELLSSVDIMEYLDDSFYYMRASTFGDVEKIIDTSISTIEFDLIVIDSLACILNEGFIDSKKNISIETNNASVNSKPLTLFLNKYNAITKSKGISMLLVNQYRNKVDLRVGTVLKEFGSKAVRYNSDVIIKISPLKSTGEYKDFKKFPKILPGNFQEFELVKSNYSNPGLIIPFYLIYGKGVSVVYTAVYALRNSDVIKESNAHYSFISNGVTYPYHGFADFYYGFIRNFDLSEEVMEQIKDYYKNKCNQDLI